MVKLQTAVVLPKFEPEMDKIADALTIQEVPMPEPGEGQVLLKVLLRPINPIDHICIQGYYHEFKVEDSPAIPGFEAVAETVHDSKRFKKGQRVISKHWAGISKAKGTWQEYVAASEESLEAVPEDLSMEQAASFWINPMTVVGMLSCLNVPRGEWMIQTAAGSSLGRMLISVAKHRGIKTINIVRRSAQKQELLDLGADVVIATDKEEIEPVVDKVTEGKGAYGGMDAVVGEMTGKLISCIRPSGRLLIYGLLSGLTLTASAQLILFGQREIVGFTMALWFYGCSKEAQDKHVKEAFDLLAKKVIDMPAKKTFHLRDASEAFAESLKPGLGKVYISN